MRLRNVNIIGTPGLSDILFRNDQIQDVVTAGTLPDLKADFSLVFDQAIAFPGLINSHDHLDFNLFPPLGNRIYSNYTEWGRDIHQTNQAQIARVLGIPLALRVQWGMYKNLLNGVTTVVNHGAVLPAKDELITIFQQSRSLHSPAFEKNWKWKLNFSFTRSRPVVIHLGEGTDESAIREIDAVARWNVFNKKVIAVHGVGMNKEQARAFHALIWCPASNYFLLNKTAAVGEVRKKIPVLFGTDSTLTASWNLWEHLRMARAEKAVSDEGLLNMLTRVPAKTWGLGNTGEIKRGYQADLVVAEREKGTNGLDDFYALDPGKLLLVIHRGHIRLFDEHLLDQMKEGDMPLIDFKIVFIQGRGKYIQGDLPGLMQKIHSYRQDLEFPIYASRPAVIR
jgi:cytosine/adenosine deaminase-related metal-dependent hydrolase